MNKVLVLLFAILMSCSHSKTIHTENTQSNVKNLGATNMASYEVYKIDSVNSFYLVYARKNDSLYKIVSKKEYVENGDRIQKGNVYGFQLHARSENRTIAGAKLLPQNSLLVTCFSYDDSTKICLERDSINDLHYADNLRGLYLIKQK